MFTRITIPSSPPRRAVRLEDGGVGLLVDGHWHDDPPATDSSGGAFERPESPFRHFVTADGSAGPSGGDGFRAEAGRYHLYASYACPWAHRALIYRALKGLDALIDVSFVHWFMGDKGWSFRPDDESLVGDCLFQSDFMHEIYTRADPDHTGRVTVPVLWDTRGHTIVSNESSEIIRMFNSAFDGVGATAVDFYPLERRETIDRINERVYHTLNNGVYRAGFAASQSAYDSAVLPLFDTLDWLESILDHSRFLTGDQPLEADWRLLPTLLRFDLVYHGHFKCNRRRIADYPNLSGYTRELYQWPGVAATCQFEHARRHYYASHASVNPTRIVAIGPANTFDAPHGRGR